MDALPQVINVSPNWSAPVKQNALMQTTSKAPVDVDQNAWQMQVTRNREGLGVPLKMAMELHAANQVGRLPFMNSSNMMRDVLLARDEMIDFTDILGNPELFEFQNHPHATVEKMAERHNTNFI
ncbi:PREDICTED: proteasome maturation protein-like [Rhagoletis zephyria]|uniref:proteasome maturation protein-like n=1 Tax=Rhagoletis zephyria TaxID=28612 RepID=UPI000811349B|nr:PREDICTED: proteasome maturation protein-like [Rhagoletis zephyria]